MILACACSSNTRNIDVLKIVRYLLELGANPKLIIKNDLIVYDMGLGDDKEIIEKCCLDGLFRSFGYKCK